MTLGVKPNPRRCDIKDCDRPHKAKGMCAMHYRRYMEHGHPGRLQHINVGKTCQLEGCDLKATERLYCHRHYEQSRTGNKQPSLDRVQYKHGHAIRAKDQPRGLARSGTYNSWQAMKARCNNKKQVSYDRYGGRGITICPEWNNSFEQFLADMGERPEGKTLDRINNDGNYEPTNCRWATPSQQRNNQRITNKGENMSSLIENIDKEIKQAKEARKALDRDIKALEQAKVALAGLKKKKTTKTVRTAKKADKISTNIQGSTLGFVAGQE